MRRAQIVLAPRPSDPHGQLETRFDVVAELMGQVPEGSKGNIHKEVQTALRTFHESGRLTADTVRRLNDVTQLYAAADHFTKSIYYGGHVYYNALPTIVRREDVPPDAPLLPTDYSIAPAFDKQGAPIPYKEGAKVYVLDDPLQIRESLFSGAHRRQ